MPPGRPLLTEAERSNLPSPYLPKVESETHQAMYAYYESMGERRSLQKVADKFNKSRAAIALVARAFKWAERIGSAKAKAAKDPLITQNKPRIDSTRKKLIKVVEEIADTLSEMADISRNLKRGRNVAQNVARLDELRIALSVWGFEWKSPKDFKSLMETLKEVKTFSDESAAKGGPSSATQINAEKFELHIEG